MTLETVLNLVLFLLIAKAYHKDMLLNEVCRDMMLDGMQLAHYKTMDLLSSTTESKKRNIYREQIKDLRYHAVCLKKLMKELKADRNFYAVLTFITAIFGYGYIYVL